MDFFKSCGTNVHVVEDVFRTNFSLYEWAGSQVEGKDKFSYIHALVADLRRLRVLCAVHEGSLWVFGELETGVEQVLEAKQECITAVEHGVVKTSPDRQIGGNKKLVDVLIEAIERALGWELGKNHNALRVSPWTWIVPDGNRAGHNSSDGVIARLHMKLTPSGALYLIPQVSVTNLRVTEDPFEDIGGVVVLSPSGKPAKITEPIPDLARTELLWKTHITTYLRSEGIEINNQVKWATLRVSHSSDITTIPWPSSLCLSFGNDCSLNGVRTTTDVPWQYWFSRNDGLPTYEHPFTAAETLSKNTLSGNLGTQQPSSRGIEPPNHPTSLTELGATPANTVTSPQLGQRNSDLQPSTQAIYPTPPAGLTQALPSSQISTDSQIVTQPIDLSASEIDNIYSSDSLQLKDSETDRPLSQEPGQTDLFGDTGEMEFGEHAIEDSDFNFFDEPDDDAILNPTQDTEMFGTSDHEGEMDAPTSANVGNLDGAMTGASHPDSQLQDATRTYDSENQRMSNGRDSSMNIDTPDTPLQGQQSDTPGLPLAKPLSPFGVRERILPPPVPASISLNEHRERPESRRRSTFGPVAFKDGFNLATKYAERTSMTPNPTIKSSPMISSPDITLPSARKRGRKSGQQFDITTQSVDESSESEDDSYGSSDESDDNRPPTLPWNSRKRKRDLEKDSAIPFSSSIPDMWPDEDADMGERGDVSRSDVISILEQILHDEGADILRTRPSSTSLGPIPASILSSKILTERKHSQEPSAATPIEKVYDLSDDDLVHVAQIISDQSVSISWSMWNKRGRHCVDTAEASTSILSHVRAFFLHTLQEVLPDSATSGLNQIALIKEPLSRSVSTPVKGQQSQPRPLARTDSMMTGPDYFTVPAPFVKIQRGSEDWEMLPTCLAFWEPLGLGPASGPKNVRAFCVYPANDDVRMSMEQFVVDLGTAYESCKLGSHKLFRQSKQSTNKTWNSNLGAVELVGDEDIDGAFRAFANVCKSLGEALAGIPASESGRTNVVYMLNPFSGREAMQHMCACFWILFKAYSEGLPKLQRGKTRSDVVLQILPVDMVASFDAIAMPEPQQMAATAREVYDRCPPLSREVETPSALPMDAAPSVELASPAPKRIGFQLVPDPPGDLLHEGSILHLAYTRSRDGQWVNVAWTDNTGRYQSSTAFCLCGKSFVEVAEDIWERTSALLDARPVTWRVFIVTDESLDKSIVESWRAISIKARAQALCVTMLSVQIHPVLQLITLQIPIDQPSRSMGQDGGFPTPVSTPQATTFTSSPDVSSGHGNNAPPTPAPSEPPASVAETDPDAHLVDLTDETCAVLLSPKISGLLSPTGLATGALFKRGDVEHSAGDSLPSLSVSLHFTVQVKPNGNIDEGTAKHAELMLREVLRSYRNLALLTKAKGLEFGTAAVVPLHIAIALRGAEGLDGMLP